MEYKKILTFNLHPPHYFKNLKNRLNTLSANGNLMKNDIDDLAKSGFYYDISLKQYKCAYCQTSVAKLATRAFKYHAFSTCPKSMRLLRENESLRKKSFASFKSSKSRYRNEANEYAKNGFYFCGSKNEIRCSDCDIVVVKLSKTDSIQDVHKKYSPFCCFTTAPAIELLSPQFSSPQFSSSSSSAPSFLSLNKPSAPPLLIEDDENERTEIDKQQQHVNRFGNELDFDEINYNDLNKYLKNMSLSPPPSSVHTSLSPSIVVDLPCIVKNNERAKYYNDAGGGVCGKRNNNNDNNNGGDSIVDYNNNCNNNVSATIDEKYCKICFDTERQICFLPCGHVSTCEKCSKRCSKCCICRQPVKSKIKIFL
ncbi:Inhibitor of apoptosis 2 [Trabala vishnou gigantina nucleopolyhedrovirus]|uniref:Inhibitor of apoptosis 2 n=1 Tax=Trabala vishnou gigantina nucleopolyhedrovirus TaxID=2863583 RepID=UPI002481E3D4|nr:Inhibitor of apoptosis 2 [Trabala vishnou gigantina nucleopolyhedrovirus]QYC92691.1 Inhibitor of apoptosis 2 [Trabala vishnou gigantina nucleopolyhedrovirus]